MVGEILLAVLVVSEKPVIQLNW